MKSTDELNEKLKMADKMYRLKHKATGLYYIPGPSRLSEKGKIYHSAGNLKTFLGGTYATTIHIDPQSRVGKKYKETWENLDRTHLNISYNMNGERYTDYEFPAKAEDFEVEYLFKD